MAIQVNFPKEGGQSAFTYSFKDCVGSPNVVFDQTTYTWIALNKTTTQVTISASEVLASQITSRSGRVNIKVDGTTCENYFEVSQAGNSCDCSAAITTGTSSVAIPQAGGTNIEIGRYTADTNCVTISASGVSDQSWLTNVTLANGIVKADLTPNYNASRSATITIAGTMKSDSSKCTKTIGITQPGLSCDCSTAFIATPGSVTQAGSAGASVEIGTYTSDATCVQSVSGTGTSSESWITNVTVSGGKINGIVAANTGTASRTTTITTKATLKNGTECPKTFTLTQQGVACSCGSIVVDTSHTYTPIPQSGATGGFVIGYYKCGTSVCNWCDSWTTVMTDGTNNYNCIVSLTNSTSFTVSLASGVVVPANDDQQGNAKTYTLNISNGGTFCTADTITQNGLADCTCEGLIGGGNPMVTEVNTYFDGEGSDGEVILISGDTKGCGGLVAYVNGESAIMLEGFTVQHTEGSDLYYWKASVGSWTGTRYADVNFNYVNRRGIELPCSQPVHISQGAPDCSCPTVNTSTWPDTITLANGDGNYDSSEIIYSILGKMNSLNTGGYYNEFCQAVVVKYASSNQTWATVSSSYDKANKITDIRVMFGKNKTGSPRELDTTFIVLNDPVNMYITDLNYGSRSGWVWNDLDEGRYSYNSCYEKQVKIIQPTRTPCTCENADFNVSGYGGRVFEVNASAGTHSYSYTVACGALYDVTISDPDDPTRVVPSSEISINISHDSYISDRYDDSGVIKMTVGSNNTSDAKTWKLEFKVGDECTFTYDAIQDGCGCNSWDDFSTISLALEATQVSAYTSFWAPCNSEDTNWTFGVSVPFGCSWLETPTITRFGSSNQYQISVNTTGPNTGEKRSCTPSVSVYNNDFTCYSFDLFISQDKPASTCDECSEQKDKIIDTISYVGWEAGDNYIGTIETGTSCYAGTLMESGITYDVSIEQRSDDDYTKFEVALDTSGSYPRIKLTSKEDNETSNNYTVHVMVKMQHLGWNGSEWVPVDHYDSFGNQCNTVLQVFQEHKYIPVPCDSCDCAPAAMPSTIYTFTAETYGTDPYHYIVPCNQTNYQIGTVDLGYITSNCRCDDCNCIKIGVYNASEQVQGSVDDSGNIYVTTTQPPTQEGEYIISFRYEYNDGSHTQCGTADRTVYIKLIRP